MSETCKKIMIVLLCQQKEQDSTSK